MRRRGLILLMAVSAIVGGGALSAPARTAPASAARSTTGNTLQRFVLRHGRMSYRGPVRPAGLLPDLAWARRHHASGGRALKRFLIASFIRAGASAQAVQAEPAASPSTGGGLFLEPAGDLDRDGHPDLLGQRWSDSGTQVIVEGIRGVDGTVLWEKTLSSDFGYAFPAALGPKGGAGALVVSYTFGRGIGAFFADAGTFTMTVTAISGSGRVPMRLSFRGSYADLYSPFTYDGVSSYDIPYFVGSEHAASGPADDFLVATDQTTYASTGQFASTVDAELISGTDGSVFGSSSMHAVNREPFPVAGGDLSGDGLDDYLFVAAGGSSGEISAQEGTDGAQVWDRKNAPVTWDSFIFPAGDPTGDGRADILLWNIDFDRFGYTGDASKVVLLSGANGATVGARQADFGIPLGDINGDRRVDIGLITVRESSASVGVAYRAVDAKTGHLLYSTAYSVPIRAGDDLWGEFDLWLGVGDVQPDGVVDLAHNIVVNDLTLHTTASSSGVVSGSTGAVVRPGPFGQPLYGAVDGSGDDFAQQDSSLTQLSAQDGLSGQDLWTAPLSTPQYAWVQMWAIDLDGDGHAEVIAEIDGYNDQTDTETITDSVFRGTDGSVLWSK